MARSRWRLLWQALGFCDIWLRHIYCCASFGKLSASAIFGFATYTVAPPLESSRLLRYLASPHILLRLGNCKQACIALSFCVYLTFGHISCCASFGKLSASAIFGLRSHIRWRLGNALGFCDIWPAATYPVAPRQCKLNKFICIALGFCVYLQIACKFSNYCLFASACRIKIIVN